VALALQEDRQQEAARLLKKGLRESSARCGKIPAPAAVLIATWKPCASMIASGARQTDESHLRVRRPGFSSCPGGYHPSEVYH
jgi:hypothetical protein